MSATFDVNKEFEERSKLNEPELVARMDEWAASGRYGEDMKKIKFCGPKVVSEAVGEIFPVNERKDVRIVDVGAGTGDLCEQLTKLGFKNIDGIDPSREMMKIARKRNLYQNYYVEYMDGKQVADIDTDSYDCAAASGAIAEGLMPTNTFFELVRIVKPGGVIVFCTYVGFEDSVLEYRNRVRPLFERFEREKVWKMAKKEKVPQYLSTADGWLFVFQVLVSDTAIPKLPKIPRKQ